MTKDIKAHENGTYLHYPETRHSTIALTEEAVTVMKDHKKKTDNPLFMYLSYNDAHSPLQPEASWLEDCSNIPHLWRYQYCGRIQSLLCLLTMDGLFGLVVSMNL